MSNLERIEEDLLKGGVEIDWYPVKGDGYINLVEPSEPYIAVNPDLPMRKKRAVAYHEVGHLRMELMPRMVIMKNVLKNALRIKCPGHRGS